MSAFVRVKRRIDEEPLEAFVLNGKKRRLNDEEGVATTSGLGKNGRGGIGKDEVSTILKFAGTMLSQDDGTIREIARLTKDEAKQLVQEKSRRPTNRTELIRDEMRHALHENRFHVVNRLRTTLNAVGGSEDSTDVGENAEAKEITILDVEKKDVATEIAPDVSAITASSPSFTTEAECVLQPSNSDGNFVYDLYLPETEQHATDVDLMDENYLSVHGLDDLVYEDSFSSDKDKECDSEDSNDENFIANDYPEEEDCSNEDESTLQIRKGVEKFMLSVDEDDESDVVPELSSEDEDCVQYNQTYVYTTDLELEQRFTSDVDYHNVNRVPFPYGSFMNRVIESHGLNDGSGISDEDMEDADESCNSASDNSSNHD